MGPSATSSRTEAATLAARTRSCDDLYVQAGPQAGAQIARQTASQNRIPTLIATRLAFLDPDEAAVVSYGGAADLVEQYRGLGEGGPGAAEAFGDLEADPAGVDKLVRAGILSTPITATEVEHLTGRDRLQGTSGALTVLRTDAREEADRTKYPADPRRWMGFHVEHSDHELEAASLRWWRSDPAKAPHPHGRQSPRK